MDAFFSKNSLFDFAVSISDSFKTVRGIMDAFGQVAMCASVLLIVALTCERHFAIRSPHRVSIQYFWVQSLDEYNLAVCNLFKKLRRRLISLTLCDRKC